METDPLTAAFARYLADRDEPALLRAIARHGGRGPSPAVGYPAAHRVCDIQLGAARTG